MYDSPFHLRPLGAPGTPFAPQLRYFGSPAPSFLRPPFSYNFGSLGVGPYHVTPSLPTPPHALDTPPAVAAPDVAPVTAPAPDAEPDEPQAAIPNLGFTNAAWMPGNPLYTLTTEFTSLLPLWTETKMDEGATLRPSFQVAVRDRLGPHSEFGLFGLVGGKVPVHHRHDSTGSGAFGLSLHLGPEGPSDDNVHFGSGAWFTLSQVWGAEPDRTSPPPGWSANPTFNALFAQSWARKDKWGFDIVGGVGASRWGAVNDVTVGGFVNPFIGFNYAFNAGKNDVFNIEATAGPNLGLAPYDGQPGPRTPFSFGFNAGIGWQHTRGDYVIGLEPWLSTEQWSNIANPGASPFNWSGGLRIGLGAINPRRTHIDDD